MDVLRPHQGEAGALLCRLVSGEAVIPTKVLGGITVQALDGHPSLGRDLHPGLKGLLTWSPWAQAPCRAYRPTLAGGRPGLGALLAGLPNTGALQERKDSAGPAVASSASPGKPGPELR